MSILRNSILFGTIVCLSACSSGDSFAPNPVAPVGGTPDLAAFIAEQDSHNALEQEIIGDTALSIGGLPSSDLSVIPTSGAITFVGSSSSDIPLSDGTLINLLGDANVTANFATDGVSGTISNLSAAEVTLITEVPITALSTEGSIGLTTGAATDLSANTVNIDYNGTVTIDDIVIVMDGTLSGDFRSTPGITPDAITALAVSDIDNPTLAGGETVDVTTFLVGEAQ